MRPLIVMLIDRDGVASSIAEAIRCAGHRVVTITGIDTAVAVVGSISPDVVLVRANTVEAERRARGRLAAAARAAGAPLRFIRAPERIGDALAEPFSIVS